MKKYLLFACILIGISGCASSTEIRHALVRPTSADGHIYPYFIGPVKNTTADAPSHFINAIQGYVEQGLKKRSLLLPENETPNIKVQITVTGYRMRSGFSRQMFGLFAGKDGVDSIIQVVDARTGNILGSSMVSTYNITAIGEQDDIARMHAEEIVKFLSGENKVVSKNSL